LTNWSQIFKKKKLDEDSFDHARVTTGLSLQKDLIQANAVADSTVVETVDEAAATEVVVAETVDEAATEVVVAETVDEVATEVVVAETVDEAAETEVVVDSDNVAKAAVAVPADTDFKSD
jgi:hypothetical protein